MPAAPPVAMPQPMWDPAMMPPINVIVNFPAPAPPPRFSLRRLRPAWNGSAAIAALILVPVTSRVLGVEDYGVLYTGAVLAAIGELVAVMKQRRSGWLVRALSFHVVFAAFLTPVGLHALSYPLTGV
ncbi:hypothetical protein AB0D10_41625 [Kitasatospora sp. NPDC048545]|uniref:hypothetical protein n=1 Tax=Kitasatospora sp. NPDC048545 TaxID=3157208 RepID=UPI00340D5F13